MLQLSGFGHRELWLRDFVPAKCTPENVLTTADLLRFADPTLGLVVKGALEAFFSLQLQCM
jgi:hypothetical protein